MILSTHYHFVKIACMESNNEWNFLPMVVEKHKFFWSSSIWMFADQWKLQLLVELNILLLLLTITLSSPKYILWI